MSFNGTLVKIGSGNTPIPYKFMKSETYKCYPEQRLETSAKRVSSGLLHRTTCDHMPTKIEWEVPAMWNDDIEEFTALFEANWISRKERKVQVNYFDTWSNMHRTGTFYMPDVEMDIMRVDRVNHRILYAPMRIALIEY